MYRCKRAMLLSSLLLTASTAYARDRAPAGPVYTPVENAIIAETKTLRSTPDGQRGAKTSAIAAQIAALPGGTNNPNLAVNLSHLSTEGDVGHQTLQDVADALSLALKQRPASAPPVPPGKASRPASQYLELARLVRYEQVTSSLDSPEFERAKAVLDADVADIEKIDFTLRDLSGDSWTLSSLRGNVVVVNFWATWCPPCRKEMPDLAALSRRFASQGLVVVSISDEDHSKVATTPLRMISSTLSSSIREDISRGGFTLRAFRRPSSSTGTGSWPLRPSTCERGNSSWPCWRRRGSNPDPKVVLRGLRG